MKKVVRDRQGDGSSVCADRSIFEILPEIVANVKLPVIAAGGIVDGNGIAKVMRMGASGVQMATRFVASLECAVSDKFKQMYLKAQPEDIMLIRSPVGMPGRAIRNPFVSDVMEGCPAPITGCELCLKDCSREYCIIQALENARLGMVNNGVVFAGKNVGEIKDILPVQKIFDNLVTQFEAEPD